MILRQFSSNQPYLLILIPILVISALLPAALYLPLIKAQEGYPSEIILNVVWLNKWLWLSAATVLLLAGSWLSNVIFNKNEFHTTPSNVPALIYALIGIGACYYQISFAALLANVFLLFGLNIFLSVFRQTRVLSEYFVTGFWFGISALIYPPYLVLLPGMWLSIVISRAFSWREFIVPLLAFITPFLYWIVWNYWNGWLDSVFLFHKTITFNQQELKLLNPPQKVFLAVVGISFVLSIFRFLFLSNRNSNKSRNLRVLVSIITVILAIAFVLSGLYTSTWEPASLLVSVSLILGYWFTNYRYSLIAPFVFYGCILSVIWLILEYYNIIIFK